MSVADSIYALMLLFAHVLKRGARLNFEEKMDLLRIVIHLACHPHDGVHVRGRELLLRNTTGTLDQLRTKEGPLLLHSSTDAQSTGETL